MNRTHYILGLLSLLLLLATLYGSFIYAPDEAVMGAIQRIFYLHVGCAMAAYATLCGLLVAGVLYLVSRSEKADCSAEALTGLSFLLCTIVLATGMIWGNSAWNTPWRWEPRLTSFLVLWLMLGGLLALRKFSSHYSEVAKPAAVYGILCALNVPVVMLSVKFMDISEQLHPEVSSRQGFGDPAFLHVFVLGIVASLVVTFWAYLVNLQVAKNSRLVSALEANL